MATIHQRKDTFYVIYSYTDTDGKRKQKWESFRTMEEARRRRVEIEYKEQTGELVIPRCITMNELLTEYITIHGKANWSLSTYNTNVALIEHYVRPQIGKMKLADINTRVMENYYRSLLKTKTVSNSARAPRTKTLTPYTVREINKILRNCFNQAIKWDLMTKNPAANATLPKVESAKREIWTSDTLLHALDVCDDPRLALAMNVAFSCSLRMGELLGLTWDCVDISPESIAAGSASVFIDKELQRVSRKVLDELEGRSVMVRFPAQTSQTSTVLVLKSPKTKSSVRRVYLPKAVAEMLTEWKRKQDETMELLGDEYQNYNLVFAGSYGLPTEDSTISTALKRLIKENDLPPVVFHSFRHASITYKLKLNGGDVKSVQGDSGHSQVKMVTDVYAHILDEDRRNNAQLFQKAFYDGMEKEEEPAPQSELLQEGTAEWVAKLLGNPEVLSLLGALAKNLQNA